MSPSLSISANTMSLVVSVPSVVATRFGLAAISEQTAILTALLPEKKVLLQAEARTPEVAVSAKTSMLKESPLTRSPGLRDIVIPVAATIIGSPG